MAAIDDFLPDIMADVESCPEFTVRRAVVQAAIKFCEDTQAWMEWLDPILVFDNKAVYELDLPTGADLVMVREVWAPGVELTAKTVPEISRIFAAWQTATGAPRFYNMVTWGELRLYPIPLNAGADLALTVRVALKPKATATTIPDAIASRWRRAVLERAKADLMAMPSKAWSSAEQAGYHETLYVTERDKASADRLNDGVSGTGTVYSVRFGR
ncbi:hypothetical protein [Cupriavidus sp. UYPR2.512]|uniref:phage adaptor protein n=1 Tax=Cupriavidus sp. UYPR2.512 TaxID=1080187 RepID=UPI000361DE4E|nr:hypothetical protein [Cupriavidus sp. UYPR2.512]UIF90856.1 hypothetical protein KAF44_32220 [Cupriavidus necator]